MRAIVFGDSIVRPLKENCHRISSLSVEVHCFPGASLRTLRHHLYNNYQQEYEPDVVIVHAGTNSLGLLPDEALKEADELFEAAKHVTQCGNVLFSVILPRWDCQIQHERAEEFNDLFRKQFPTIDCCTEMLPEHLYRPDQLHVAREHGMFFTKVFESKLWEVLTAKDKPYGSQSDTPKWWIPPLRPKPRRKKPQLADEEQRDNAEEEQRDNADEVPLPYKHRSRPWKTCNNRVKRLYVHTAGGFTQIGFRAMPSTSATKIQIPVPSGCMTTTSRSSNDSTNATDFSDLPKAPSKYINRKHLGQMKSRLKRRVKKSRARKKRFNKVSLIDKKNYQFYQQSASMASQFNFRLGTRCIFFFLNFPHHF